MAHEWEGRIPTAHSLRPCPLVVCTIALNLWADTDSSGSFSGMRLEDGRNTDLTVSRDRAREFKTRLLGT